MTSSPIDTALVNALVEDATAAPSMHNAQPWKFRFLREKSALQISADLERAIPRADPTGRAMHLGCGAALMNLRVSAAHAGLQPITRLVPDPADPLLLAEVELVESEQPDSELAGLYPAVRRRHTSRYPFTDEEIPQAILGGLSGCAVLEGARLVFPDSWHANEVLDLVHDAEAREAMDPGLLEELAHWTMTDAGENTPRPEGIPAAAMGPRQRDVTAPVRDFAGRRPVPGRESAAFEQRPQLALLGTTQDRPADWLQAGQAMERVLLQATLDGLAASLTSQALEWRELRWAVRDPESATGHVQMVIRLGYGPEGPATPRRPVGDVLEIV